MESQKEKNKKMRIENAKLKIASALLKAETPRCKEHCEKLRTEVQQNKIKK